MSSEKSDARNSELESPVEETPSADPGHSSDPTEDKKAADGIEESVANESPTTDEGTEELKAKDPKKSGFGKALLFLIILFLILAAAGGGWYYAQQELNAGASEATEALSGQLAELDSQVSSLAGQLATQGERQANMQVAVADVAQHTESQLLSLANRVSESESTTSGDWVLAEAEYLLRIANQRLVTSQDTSGAVDMMLAADAILLDLAYPEFTEVRRQLVADITRLKLVDPVDYEGIYFALDALLASVNDLSGTEIERLTIEERSAAEEQGWRKYWSMAKNALGRYVVINSDAQNAPRYLLSDQQEVLIKSQLQLQIRQAQLAMLAGESSVYTAALEAAADQIERSYAGHSEAVALQQALRDLASRPVTSDSVNINGSIRSLEEVVDQLKGTSRSSADGILR